jgi:hypothetical protein
MAKNATENLRALRRLTEPDLQSAVGTDGILTFDIAYNQDEPAWEQLVQVYAQKAGDELSAFWRMMNGNTLLPDWLKQAGRIWQAPHSRSRMTPISPCTCRAIAQSPRQTVHFPKPTPQTVSNRWRISRAAPGSTGPDSPPPMWRISSGCQNNRVTFAWLPNLPTGTELRTQNGVPDLIEVKSEYCTNDGPMILCRVRSPIWRSSRQ